MNDISGSAEVNYHGYGTAGESLEDYSCPVVPKSREDHHVSGSHATEDLLVAHATTEGNTRLNFEGINQLLKAVSLPSITDDSEVGHIASQKWSRCAQCEITSLPGNQAANENQRKFGAALRNTRVIDTRRATNAGLRDKK
jgi:hypothetical protein